MSLSLFAFPKIIVDDLAELFSTAFKSQPSATAMKEKRFEKKKAIVRISMRKGVEGESNGESLGT